TEADLRRRGPPAFFSALATGPGELVGISEQYTHIRLRSRPRVDHGQPAERAVDRVAEDHIGSAHVDRTRPEIPRPLPGPPLERLVAGEEVHPEGPRPVEPGVLVARVVLGHDRGERLSGLRWHAVRCVVEERVTPGQLGC